MAIPNITAALSLSAVTAKDTTYYLNHLEKREEMPIPFIEDLKTCLMH